MSITYKFASLASLADWCDNKARELRGGAMQRKRKVDQARDGAAASAWESIAHTLRNAIIEPKDN